MNNVDDEIIEEIKALQDAIAQESSPESYLENQDDDDSKNNSREEIEDCEPSTSSGDLELRALEVNQALLAEYKSAIKAIQQRLLEISNEKKLLDIKISTLRKAKKERNRPIYSKAMQPYFKDKDRFPAPLNEDAILKIQRREIMLIYEKSFCHWSMVDRDAIWTAIRQQAAAKYLKQQSTANQINNSNEIGLQLMKDIIGPRGTQEFDWLKIAAQDLRSKHTADESRVLWNVYLHPDINHQVFSSSEDKALYNIARDENFQNWDAIADKLATSRTGYQCFIRYATVIRQAHKKEIQWTDNEKEILLKLVEALKIGSYIPWNLVTFYFGNRTKNQIYCEWKYSIGPKLTKGPFKRHEDQLLLEGVAKYGHDFPRISAEFIPNRSSVSLSGRFKLLMLKVDDKYNKWTLGEDMQLLKLYDQLGNNWKKISTIMNKNRTYVRHRYFSLQRKLAKGKTLVDIRREQNISTKTNDKEEDSECDEVFILPDIKVENELDIDTRLLRHFARINSPIGPPGRRQASYECEKIAEQDAKLLYQLFENLDVHLNIPDDLDTFDLTKRDKELLQAYKRYKSAIVSPSTSDHIEQVRLRMFGPDEDNDSPPYVPPPPFGLCFKSLCRKNKKYNNKTTSDDTQVKLDFQFEKFENIEKMLNDDERRNFEKFLNLICIPNFEKPVEKTNETKFIPMDCESNEEPGNISTSGTIRISWGKSNDKRILNDKDRQNSFIQPNYSIFMGYEMLRYMREINGNLEWAEGEREMSQRPISAAGKKAFQLFKARFFKTFKYAIGAVCAIEGKETPDNQIDDPVTDCESDDSS